MKPANILKILITATLIFLLPTFMEYQASANSTQQTGDSTQDSVDSVQDAVSSDQSSIAPIPSPSSTLDSQPSNGTNQQSDLSEFRYPGSQVLSSGENLLKMESSDDPQKITDWYKEKLINLKMSVKSFITTRANEKVLNKLVTTNQNQQISVEISRENKQQKVQISVVVTNL